MDSSPGMDSPSPLDLERFLASHGLSRLAPALRAAGIDMDVVESMTETDFIRCGINLGDCRRLVRALDGRRPAAEGERSPIDSGPAVRADAERRTLTVLFADLVDFTALSSRIDPEDLRAAVRDFQQACRDAVERYDGAIAQYLGDGVLAYFGFPRAHEDDAERATRAGIEAAANVAALRACDGTALAARVGIATGLVVVGDVVGTELVGGLAAIGQTPNLAARLQSLASAGEVILSPATRRLLGDRFDLELLDETNVKGMDERIRPSRVLGASGPVTRFEAQRGARRGAFVGRMEEIGVLSGAWSESTGGRGRVVQVTGEAGIGKSRLCFELRRQIADTSRTEVLLQCSAHHRGSQWHPVARWVEHSAGIQANDRRDSRLEKLRSWIEPRTPGPRVSGPQLLAVLAKVLSIPGAPALPGSPQAQRVAIQTTLSQWLLDAAAGEPMLLMVEDAHWIDPTTAELLGSVRGAIADARVLMLITTRDAEPAAWMEGPTTDCVRLEKLDKADGRRIVDELVEVNPLPEEIVTRILDRADGVPLFLEETTRSALDSRASGAPLDALREIPATLHELLLARLQGLADAMPFIQAGAAIGREFRQSLVTPVIGWSDERIGAAAQSAVQAGLLECHGSGAERLHVFRHALIQDAAYSTMLLARRREVHTRIADVLESAFPEYCEGEPEVLARHLTEAGHALRATNQWERAADHALARFAGVEAIAHLGAAISLVNAGAGTYPDDASRRRRELGLLLKLGPAAMTIHATASGEPERIYRRVAELAREFGTLEEQFVAAFNLWYIYDNQARHALAESALGEVHRLAEASGDDELQVQAAHADWTTSIVRGAFTRCLQAAESGLARRPGEDRQFRIDLFAGHDPLICALGHRAVAEWVLGEFERSARSVAQLRQASASIAHVPSRILADYISALVAVFARDAAFARSLAEPAHALCRRLGVKRYEGVFGVLGGWATAIADRTPEAVERMIASVALIESMGMVARLPVWQVAIADACLATGQWEQGWRAVKRALELVGRQGEEGSRAWALLVRAGLHRACERSEEAKADFRDAIEIATRQGGRGWALRASRHFAELLDAEGRGAEVVALLVPLCAQFPDSARSDDLDAARRLVERHTTADARRSVFPDTRKAT